MKAWPQSTMAEGLRPLVGTNGWDYCILWKLSQDQRFLEWMGCCCSGAEAQNGAALFTSAVSASKLPCRDVMFRHPRTRICDALEELPSSIPLDSSSGLRAQALITNDPIWQTKLPDSTISHETVREKTMALVPVPGGLVELFASKHMAEEQQTVEFVMSQCTGIPYEQAEAMNMVNNSGDPIDPQQDQNSNLATSADGLQPWIPPQSMAVDPPNLPWDPSDQSRLYDSPLNLFSGPKNSDIFFDGSTADSYLSNKPPPAPLGSTIESSVAADMATAFRQSYVTSAHNLHSVTESSVSREVAGHEKESIKMDAARRADSGSEGSDQVDEDEEHRVAGRSGKRHHSKNLVAERKRRKKLNDRLLTLRALVPKITKMDRASILGDAIQYVMELQKQVKDLQDELEETNPEDDDGKQNGSNNNSNSQMEVPNQHGMMNQGLEHDDCPNGSRMIAMNNSNPMEQSQDLGHDDKGNQMEPQVEVRQVEGNEFFLKVLCEYKQGGFARLMEAMSSLGLEVTNANVTQFRTLVLNVFRVERRDNEVVQAEQVRNSLIEVTRDPNAGWPEPGQGKANGGGDYHHHHYHHGNHCHQHHQLNSHHHLHYHHHQP
ncbi:transcription factor ABORTED MICROSPORES isoform X2 [Phoenix dactylifera]|uniref:Transcription factor ABORTED MICROSPORES isoform X2 n=1 Tax=Phoenix dactylifera TaxID=42345 RepID=A0A8B8ZI30_PHODC|nr:transcription factor ABORTED MICROSPORES isoform X2 [Phoenix dactylifera]